MIFVVVFWLLLLLHGVVALSHDDDLLTFVTLPDVRASKFEINHIDRQRQFPGYWFVAPYGQITPENPTQRFQQYQVGPYIYDNEGTTRLELMRDSKMLIWAGSPLYDNRNIFDFKANWNIDDEPHLSFILQFDIDGSSKGSGMILNKHYEVENQVDVTNDLEAFNMHEFNIMDGGQTALACTYRSQMVNLADFGRPTEDSWVVTGDVSNGDVLFSWDSHDQIALHESVRLHLWETFDEAHSADYVHINAVDKNDAGDYIISMRFANTLYLIDGKEGHIKWRLGGTESDFVQDFTFSKQHDVKFVESNGTHHVISLMNNASDESEAEEDYSSALYIAIDESVTPKTASLLRRIVRPDNELTRLRGNVQALPNGNTFVGWSQQGYQSEHAPNGDMLMWARFVSDRFSSYRSYKFDWIGRPTAPPDVVASVYGANMRDIMTIIHVSWNGATDVAGWKFYARAYDGSPAVCLGYVNKTSFESMFVAEGYMDWISVEAVDANGMVMATSEIHRSIVPANWRAIGFDGSSTYPSPDDPSLLTDSSTSSGSSGESISVDPVVYSNVKEVAKAVYKAYEILQTLEGIMMLALLACCVGGIVTGTWLCFGRRQRLRSYDHVPSDDSESIPVEELPLRQNMDG
ncbi:uncharacterized protein N7459_006489 [Penicillium hispanicum]|uniref:uncharacterized protein n=1 Tax=Penicillium hispanicum TaxID=1080232 RepID=UPI0025417BE9|nr:uncharacterized protein N7459_006489 [Penicillium hispanicum]KAJ5577525.1 hypothetical protein N7459_006489 [Penicillium hispanicum]